MTLTYNNILSDILLHSIPFINFFSNESDAEILGDEEVDSDSSAFEEVEGDEEFDLDGELSGSASKKVVGYDFDENEVDNYDNDLYDNEDDLPAGYHVDDNDSEY